MSDEKVCIHCLQPIHLKAKRCHHCSSWQFKHFADNWGPQTRYLLLGMIGFAIIVFVSFIYLISTNIREIKNIETTGIVVKSSKILTTTIKDDNRVVVFGNIENTSTTTWARLTFEAELLNNDGDVIDVIFEVQRSLVLFPGRTVHYRLQGHASHEFVDYHSARVKVLYAKPYDETGTLY